jgi:hypothetical protein
MRPSQKVILYRNGLRGRDSVAYHREYNNKIRKDKGYDECPRCKVRYKDPSREHYVDFKNKIRCIEKF